MVCRCDVLHPLTAFNGRGYSCRRRRQRFSFSLSLCVCVTAAAVVDHIKREKKEKRGICAFFLTQLKMKKKKKKKKKN